MSKKSLIDTRPLTNEEFQDLARARQNPFHFSTGVKVIHPLKGKVPFDLYPYQKKTLHEFLINRFNVVLKFRQAGLTELISMFCLWLCMYHEHKNVVIISIKDRVAKKVLRKIKFMYKNLPWYWKVPIINGRGSDIGTSSELEFSNGSLIASIPTTEEAGRSEAVSLMVIDEAAIVRWADRIWAAAFPTLSTGGSAIINSTAYGVGNFFHKLFVDALAGGNRFNAIRLHWQMHPERDQDWYDMQREILGPRRTAQEIDGDFLTSGNTVFDLADIRLIEDSLEDEFIPIERLQNGQLLVYEAPKPSIKTYCGCDIATGRARDYSAFSIQDKYGDEKVCFKGKLPPDRLEKILWPLLKKWGKPLFAPESNDIGLGLATNFQEKGYPNLYYTRAMLRKKGESKPQIQEIPGWYTTKKNRPIIISDLEEDVRNQNNRIKNPFFCHEAMTFIYDDRNRPVAMNKDKTTSATDDFDETVYTDDSIFGEAITNFIRKTPSNNVVIKPR